MTTQLRVPLEILTGIFKELDDVQDLRNVRLACHYLCAITTSMAFRTLSVIATKKSALNLGRLLDLPDITAHVREFTFNDTGADGRGRVLNYVRSNAIQELARSFSHIHRLSRLETINFTFCPINDDRANSDRGSRHALQLSTFGALVTSFRYRMPSKLTSLSLHNLRTLDLPPFESPTFQNLLKTLRYFQLSVLYDISRDEQFRIPFRWSRFWGNLCPRVVLAAMQHALTELTLHSDAYIGYSSDLSLAGLHFPHLHALSLRNLVFEPSIGVEPFILRHTTSLAKLELLTCKLPTYAGAPWILSPPPSDPCWDTIWDRFATELTALVSLHVDDTEGSYVTLGSDLFTYFDHGFSLSISDRESQDATDVVALGRFHAIVAARSEEVCGESWGGTIDA